MTRGEFAVVGDLVARARLARQREDEPETVAASPWRAAILDLGDVVPREACCVYCGDPIRRRGQLACKEHRDLLELDSRYAPRLRAVA